MSLDALPASTDPLALIVIEDSGDDYELIAARLTAAFGQVRTIRVESREGLERALDEGGWAGVLSDHRLPSFSSTEALKIVRARAPDLPFVIVSGAIGEEVAVAAMQAGADDFVMKDKLARLGPALARAIESQRSRARRREAEAALGESEARFRSLAANLPGMVFQIEVDAGRLRSVYVGEGARRLFGLAAAEISANPGAWMGRLAPADVETVYSRFLIATAGVTASGWGAARQGSHDPGAHWIEHVVRTPSAGAPGMLAGRYVELRARARRVGEARVLWDGIATDITEQKNAEAELTRSREELRELGSHLARVRESERAAIARELHDDVGSTLTGAKFQLQWFKGRVAGDAALSAAVGQLAETVDAAIAASTRIMHDLRPAILDQGIVAALEWQARSFEQRTGLVCRFDASADEIALAPSQSIVLFRVCQEALNNVVKHAQASEVDVTLTAADDGISLEIRDNGRGIAPADMQKRGHFGVRGMRERVLALGGDITVDARDDGPGTAIRLTIPADEAVSAPDDSAQGSA